MEYAAVLLMALPFPPVDSTWAMMIVWRIRGRLSELLCAVFCTVVVHSDTYTRKLFLKLSIGLGLGLVFCVFV